MTVAAPRPSLLDSPLRAALLLAALCLLLQILPAGIGRLYNETDGQYAGAAKAMVQGGSWIIPENNGVPRLVKPPLLYWLMAGSFHAFGFHEFAARLPGALGVTAWVLATFAIGHHFGGAREGFWAGAVLLSCLGTATLGRIVMPEPVFCALITAAIWCGLRALTWPTDRRKSGASLFAALFWVCAGLACLTKGFHGLLYPLLALGIAGVIVPAWRRPLRRLASPAGILVFLALNVPWYLAVEARFPGWIQNFLGAEQAGHLTGSAAPATHYENVPAGQFLLLHLAWFFPWSIVALVAAIAGAFGEPRSPLRARLARRTPASPRTVLLLCWAGVVVLPLLLLGQRQDYYAMAAWPVFALAVGAQLPRAPLRSAMTALLVLCAGGLALCAWWLAAPQPARESLAVAERATAWSTVTGFGGEVWLGLARLGLGVLAVAAASLTAGLVLPRFCRVALTTTAAIFSAGAILGYALVAPYFSLGDAANALRKLPPEAPIVFEGGLDTASSLLFYADHPLALIGPDPDEDFITRTFGLGRERYLTPQKFAVLWASGRPLAFVVERGALARWEQLLGPLPAPTVACGTQLVIVRAD